MNPIPRSTRPPAISAREPILEAEQVPSLVTANGSFYTIEALLPKIKSISVDDLRKELRAQILALAAYDIRLDHLSDQFGILSLYSPFFDIIIELAIEFNVPVRSPIIASVKYPDIYSNTKMKKRRNQLTGRLVFTAPFKAISLLTISP